MAPSKADAGAPNYDDIPGASDAGADSAGEFYPDEPRREWATVLGLPLVFRETEERTSKFLDEDTQQPGTFLLVLADDMSTGERFTTRTSSNVVRDQLAGAQFPFKGKVIAVKRGNRTYHRIVDPEAEE